MRSLGISTLSARRGLSDSTGQIETFSLRGVCGAPQRTWVDAIRVELEHAVVKLARALGLVVQPVKVPNVLACGFDVARAVVAGRDSVSRDDRCGLQRLDLVQCSNPFEPGLTIRFREVRMDAVINGIPRDHQSQ